MEENKKGVVCFSELGEWGRFGNILFEIAAVVATAKKHNANYLVGYPVPHIEAVTKNILGYNYNLYFADKLKKVDKDWIKSHPNKFTYFYENSQYKEIDLSASFDHDRYAIVDLKGYFQSEKYFKNAESEVRELFSLSEYDDKVKKTLDVMMLGEGENPKVIALGIRLTDYLQTENFYWNLTKTDYYQKAVQHFIDKYENVVFAVFSDDIGLAETLICEGLKLKGRFIFVNNSTMPIDSFPLFAGCDGYICGNSTFHWWASYLGNPDKTKDVIMPEKWYVQTKFWTADDLYYDGVIVI